MTDAPEKIWAWRTEDRIVGELPLWAEMGFASDSDGHAYTRDDVKEAEKRAAYLRGLEDAAARCEEIEKSADEADEQMAKRKLPGVVVRLDGFEFAAAIRALAKEGGE